MWTCPDCEQKFLSRHAYHSCGERSLEDFTMGKSQETMDLFNYFIHEYLKLGNFVLHPAKSRIALAADIRFAYIHRLGKNYVDVVFQFKQCFEDNTCFYKMANIPGSEVWNHYLRIQRKEDLNDEVRAFMKLCYDNGRRGKNAP